MKDGDIVALDIMTITANASQGYILEVDLEYPTELHDLLNDYPLAPEAMQITSEMLSEYAKKLQEDLYISKSNTTKLFPNMYNKTNDVVHYRNLPTVHKPRDEADEDPPSAGL